jgi:hypothetical protein
VVFILKSFAICVVIKANWLHFIWDAKREEIFIIRKIEYLIAQKT